MKIFKSLPESFSRKGMKFVKSNLTEKEVKESGKSYRKVKQPNSDNIVFYIKEN